MNKFNTLVETLMEADTGVPDPTKGGTTDDTTDATEHINGRKIIEAMVKQLESIKEEETARIIQTKILDSNNVNVLRSLDDPIESAEQWDNLAKTLGIIYDVSKAKPIDTEDKDDKDVSRFPKFGVSPGRWNQSAAESSFYDFAYHWKRGSLLKKLEMTLKGITSLISPTAKGSTGVFA